MNVPVERTGNPKARQQAQAKEQEVTELGDGWISGHLGDEPDLRFTPSGRAVCNLSVAYTPREKNEDTGRWEDGKTVWYRVNVWGQQGENVAECLAKGDRVVVGGRFSERTYEGSDGEMHTSQEITATEIGPSLLFTEARIKRASRRARHSAAEEE